MITYSTQYRLPSPRRAYGTLYACEIATQPTAQREEVEYILAQRGLGEVLVSNGKPASREWLNRHRLSERLKRRGGVGPLEVHAACFLGFLAMKSQVAALDQILGDTGFTHEVIHHFTDAGPGPEHLLTWLIEEARRLEDLIPGYCPPMQSEEELEQMEERLRA